MIQTPDGNQLPIIDIETQAPDTAEAAKLANAAIAGLNDYLDSRAASEEVTAAKHLRFTSLGRPEPPSSSAGPRSPSPSARHSSSSSAGCAIMLGILALARGWRAVEEEEILTEVFREDDFFDPPPSTPRGDDAPRRMRTSAVCGPNGRPRRSATGLSDRSRLGPRKCGTRPVVDRTSCNSR